MKTTLFVCLLFANGLQADTVQTVPFLANLGNSGVGGSALLLVHEVLDGSGNLKSGSIEVSINSQLPIRDVEIRGNPGAIDLSSGQVQFGTGAGQPSKLYLTRRQVDGRGVASDLDVSDRQLRIDADFDG